MIYCDHRHLPLSDEKVVVIMFDDKVLFDIHFEGLSSWTLIKYGNLFNINKYGYLNFFDESCLVGDVDEI